MSDREPTATELAAVKGFLRIVAGPGEAENPSGRSLEKGMQIARSMFAAIRVPEDGVREPMVEACRQACKEVPELASINISPRSLTMIVAAVWRGGMDAMSPPEDRTCEECGAGFSADGQRPYCARPGCPGKTSSSMASALAGVSGAIAAAQAGVPDQDAAVVVEDQEKPKGD